MNIYQEMLDMLRNHPNYNAYSNGFDKEIEYLDYIIEHKINIIKAFEYYKKVNAFDFKKYEEELYKRVILHDLSKLDKEEFDAYRNYYYPENNEDKNIENYNNAWIHHYQNNSHHPEHHRENEMPKLDIYEAILDWEAMNIKFGNSAKKFYEDKKKQELIDEKFNIDFDYLEKIIYSLPDEKGVIETSKVDNKKAEVNTYRAKTKNGFIEICENKNNELAGRTRIKMTAHEIYNSTTETNKNGICWQEPYVTQNLDSAISMPYIVQWMDEENQIPFGHGDMSVDEDGSIIFTDSVTVGAVENAYVENVNIDGVIKKCMVTEGVLYNQRYPKFVKWLKEKIQTESIMGSIEFCSDKSISDKIIYANGDRQTHGRIPKHFHYSGLAILYITEQSDDSSKVIELNKKQDEEIGGNLAMEKEMMEKYNQAMKDLGEKQAEYNAVVAEKNDLKVKYDTLVESNKTIIKEKDELLEKNTDLKKI